VKRIDWNGVEAASSAPKLPPGGYVCQIVRAEDVPGKEYVAFYPEIVQGEHRGFFKKFFDALDFWAVKHIRSYKEKAQPFFKEFYELLEASNSGFKWDGVSESQFVGKGVGLVFGFEEYKKKSGDIGQRLYVAATVTPDDIRAGKFTVPDLKTLDAQKASKPAETNADASDDFFAIDQDLDDGDLPF